VREPIEHAKGRPRAQGERPRLDAVDGRMDAWAQGRKASARYPVDGIKPSRGAMFRRQAARVGGWASWPAVPTPKVA